MHVCILRQFPKFTLFTIFLNISDNSNISEISDIFFLFPGSLDVFINLWLLVLEMGLGASMLHKKDQLLLGNGGGVGLLAYFYDVSTNVISDFTVSLFNNNELFIFCIFCVLFNKDGVRKSIYSKFEFFYHPF